MSLLLCMSLTLNGNARLGRAWLLVQCQEAAHDSHSMLYRGLAASLLLLLLLLLPAGQVMNEVVGGMSITTTTHTHTTDRL
jgi:hypothetical protein